MKRQNVRKLLLMLSLLLFPITIYYFSPVLIIQGAAQGIIAASAVTFAIQFVQALFFGRAFCGYLCPAGGFQEVAFGVNDKKSKLGKRVYIKYGIWIVWIAVVTINYVMNRESLHVNTKFMMEYGISIAEPMDFIIYYFIVAILILPAFFFGRRATCHYICWMAPFMVLGTKLRNALHMPGLRIKVKKEQCVGCGQCTKNCPMSLDVKSMVQKGDMTNMECILCGKCIDQCPKDVLQYTIKATQKEK